MAWYDVTGSIADWVMASAAAYAAFNAKQWFSQRSHTKGFDKAEEILSDIDSFYRTTYKSVEELYLTMDYLNMIGSGLKAANTSEAEKYQSLENSHSEIIAKANRLIEELDLIERWSIEVKNKEIILTVTKLVIDVNICAVNAYQSVQSGIYERMSESKVGFQQSTANFKRDYEEYLSDLTALEAAYKKFKKQKFINFFKVK
ncbi:hypothetical protein ACI0YY_000226 [Cronobacter sakazakii]|uniref:hypothetical protein n=1 Tax=Cronobacter sakazakii TaxID=28141 RepID=UPI002895C5D3|nr:hypothetical protein [Cronobacter sakazakii]MDT3546886.1 hypothetical protein [Cronobacter sakazakii]MDT3633821.1 hypothetical protein [Cronobacter sakazakii]